MELEVMVNRGKRERKVYGDLGGRTPDLTSGNRVNKEATVCDLCSRRFLTTTKEIYNCSSGNEMKVGWLYKDVSSTCN
jgi:hypothetical protein